MPKEGAPAPLGETEELLQYLDGALADYAKYVGQIGQLKYTAPQLLYYRDEVQEMLELLAQEKVDLRQRWAQVRDLDLQLRAKASIFVREVGHANFKQYQIINNPPLSHWWWYLNRITVDTTPKGAPAWQWWKH